MKTTLLMCSMVSSLCSHGIADDAAADIPATAVLSPDLNRLVRRYSTQQIVGLDPSEVFTFRLKSGTGRVIRLVSVKEHRDTVVKLMRRAEVSLEVDGQPVQLRCAPYVMPTEISGLRLQVDSTSGWGNTPKAVQLSVWDATDPIVDTRRFRFPLRDFRLFSHGTQAYNEPVHLGEGDGDPVGQRFYHDYGFDLAGYEGREEVGSVVEGRIIKFWPSREDPCSVLVQDDRGFIWDHAHLKALAPELTLGARVAMGQKLGILGKTGPSGNFSHLHVGTYLTQRDLEADHANRRLNLYPWMVMAYQAQYPTGLIAVARPHHTVLTGEKVILDAADSLAFGGGRIVERRWTFHDGQAVNQARAEKVFDHPGSYIATLWVKDDRGAEDVDFCQIKVFSQANPEKAMPHIFMTSTPTQEIRPDQPVTFRCWFQGKGADSFKVDFGDGTQLVDCRSYTELRHRFRTVGTHIVTAQCEVAGLPIMQKHEVVVVATAGKTPEPPPCFPAAIPGAPR